MTKNNDLIMLLKILTCFTKVAHPTPDNKARTHGCVRNDSETHETVLLDCTTGVAGGAVQ